MIEDQINGRIKQIEDQLNGGPTYRRTKLMEDQIDFIMSVRFWFPSGCLSAISYFRSNYHS